MTKNELDEIQMAPNERAAAIWLRPPLSSFKRPASHFRANDREKLLREVVSKLAKFNHVERLLSKLPAGEGESESESWRETGDLGAKNGHLIEIGAAAKCSRSPAPLPAAPARS